MSYYEDSRDDRRRGGGFFGKLIALLLGFLLGIVSTIGGIAGLGYYVVAKIKIKDAIGKVNQYAGTTIDPLDYLTEEYAEKTVLALIQDVIPMLKEESDNNTISLSTFAKISPKVEETAEKLTETFEKYGVTVTTEELLTVPFSEFGDFIGDTLKEVRLDTVLNAVGVLDSSNAVLRAVLYGTEGTDYLYDSESGEVTLLTKAFSVKGDTFVAPDGTVYTKSGDKFVAEDGSYISVPSSIGALSATFDSEGLRNDTPDYIVYDKNGEKLYDLYEDTAEKYLVYKNGKEVTRKPLSIGDLTGEGGFDIAELFGGIRLADVLSKDDLLKNSVLLSLCYGVSGEDYVIEDGEIKLLEGGKSPTTIGSLIGGSSAELLDSLEIGTLLSVKTDDALLCSLAYGKKGTHYDVVSGEIKMKEMRYTVKDGKLCDESGNEVTAEKQGDVFAFEKDGETLYARHDSDLADNEYRIYDEDGNVVLYKKKTIAAVLDGSSELLGTIELGAVMNLDEDSDPVLLAIAYGTKEDGSVDFDSPRTLADLQGDKANELLSSVQLGSALKVQPSDDLLCALAYGTKGKHYTVETVESVDKIVMLPIVYSVNAEEKLLDDDGNEVTAEKQGDVFAFEKDGKTLYARHDADGKYYLYESETGGEPVKYSPRTIDSLRSGNSDELLKGIPLPTILKADEHSDPIVLALVYGTKEDGSVDFDNPKTLADLQGDEATNLFNGIELYKVLNLNASSDPVLLSIAFESYTIEAGKLTWTNPKTIGDLRGDDASKVFDDIELGKVLNLNGHSDPLLLSLAYGKKGTDYTVDESDAIVPSTAEGAKKPTTIKDLRGDNASDIFNSIELATVLNLNGNSDSILLSLAYESYTITNDGDKKVLSGVNPRTIEDLKGDKATELFNGIKLGTVLNLNGHSDAILLSIAYGKEGTDYTVGESGEIVSIDGGKAPATLKDLRDNGTDLFNSIELATVLGINDDSDALMKELAYGVNGEGEEIARTLGDLRNDMSAIVYDIKLATVLGLDATSNKILLSIAYESYTITNVSGKEVLSGDNPRTIKDLKNNGGDLINGVCLDQIISFDKTDKLTTYIIYGVENKHFEIETVDGVDKIVMLPIVYSVEEEKLLDDDGNEVTASKQGSYYTFEKDGKTLYARYDEASATYRLYESETGGEAIKYSPRTIGDLSGNNSPVKSVTKDLTIGDLAGSSADQSKLMTTISTWKISDLQNQEKINGIKLNQILEVGDSGLLSKLGESTLGSLKGDLDDLIVSDVIENTSDNKIISLLADTKINELSSALNTLTIQEVYMDEIYQKDTNGYYVDQGGNKVENLYYKKTKNLDGSLTLTYYSNADKTTSFTPVLTGTWKMLLEKNGKEQFVSLTGIDKLIGNMTDNMKKATVEELDTNLGLGLSSDFLEVKIDENVVQYVGKPKSRTYATNYESDNSLTLSKLTLTDLSEYVPDMIDYYQKIIEKINTLQGVNLDNIISSAFSTTP